MGMTMTATLLSGCSQDGLDLYKSLGKAKDITSMESKTAVKLNIAGVNLSKEDQAELAQISAVLDNSDITITSKVNQNKERTKAKMEGAVKVNYAGINMGIGLWSNTDYSGDKLVNDVIVELPKALSAQIPAPFTNKQYFIMDSNDIMATSAMNADQYKEVAKFITDYQPKMQAFIDGYVRQYNPNVNVINKIGSKQITHANNTTEYADIYELKINDAALKQLLHYTLKNFGENKDMLAFVKQFTLDILPFSGASNKEIAEAKAEIEKLFKQAELLLPAAVAEVDKELSKIDNIQILGDKGINIKYAVNSDGYVVSEEGTIQLVIDQAIINGEIDKPQNNKKEKYIITLDFSQDIYNINGNVEVKFPVTNSTNSITYADVVNYEIMQQYDAAVNNAIRSKNEKIIVKAIKEITALPNSPEKTEMLRKLNVALNDINNIKKTTTAINNAIKLIKNVRTSLKISDYEAANNAIVKLPKQHQGSLLKTLETIRSKVYTKDVTAAINAINKVKQSKTNANIKAAEKVINAVKHKDNRALLTSRLKAVK
jgi:hypothetical protein